PPERSVRAEEGEVARSRDAAESDSEREISGTVGGPHQAVVHVVRPLSRNVDRPRSAESIGTEPAALVEGDGRLEVGRYPGVGIDHHRACAVPGTSASP